MDMAFWLWGVYQSVLIYLGMCLVGFFMGVLTWVLSKIMQFFDVNPTWR